MRVFYGKKCLEREKYGGNISGVRANNSMALTLPVRGNFDIVARQKIFVATLALSCRTCLALAIRIRI